MPNQDFPNDIPKNPTTNNPDSHAGQNAYDEQAYTRENTEYDDLIDFDDTTPRRKTKKRAPQSKKNRGQNPAKWKTAVIYGEFAIIIALSSGIIISAIQLKDRAEAMKTLSDQQQVLNDRIVELSDQITTVQELQASIAANALGETILTYDSRGNQVLMPILPDIPLHNYDWTCLQTKDGFKNYLLDDNKIASYRGIDVSNFQGSIDWSQVKDAGIEFAMIRLGYRGYGTGAILLDEQFEANIKGATQVGIKVGVYFFSQAITEEEAIEEANFVLDAINGYNISYPIVYDAEEITQDTARTDALTIRQLTNHAIAFCETIKNAGYKPMVYGNKRWFVMRLDLSRLQEYGYPYWLASYVETPDYPYQFGIWQYSDTGSVPGIQGNVDLNISFTDFSAN